MTDQPDQSGHELRLEAVTLNCTLKRSSGERSSTDVLLDQIERELSGHGVTSNRYRVADEDIAAGVTSDEGPGDGWPPIRSRILDAQILVLATPIWLGHPASYAQRVLERLDAFLGEKDDEGRMISTGRVAMVGVVGNEDGAHHVGAELYQGLNDVGFSLAPGAMTYWVGEAMQGTDYRDLDGAPEAVASATATAARNTAHLARLLQASNYPPP